MIVKDFYSPDNLYCLKMEDTLEDAAKLFRDKKVDAAPVVDRKGMFRGLFTKNHIIDAVSSGKSLKIKVSENMLKDAVCGSPDDAVDDRYYFRHRFHPVIEEGKPVGLVTMPDVINVYYGAVQKKFRVYSSIVNSSRNIIVAIDMDGHIITFNRAAESFFGKKKNEVKGKNIDVLSCERELAGLLSEKPEHGVRKVNLRGRHFLGRGYPIEYGGNELGRVLIFQDLTDLVNILEELDTVKELNQDLDAIIDSSSDGIFVCDGEGNVLRVNRAYEEMTGLDTSLFIGKNMKDLVEDGIYSRSSTLLALEQKDRISIIQKTGTGKTLLVTANPVLNKKGEIVRVVNNNRDITELKNLVKKLEHSQMMTERYRAELESMRLNSFNIVEGMVVSSGSMNDFVETIKRLARVDSTILITGESGTGKELAATIIHEYSPRKGNAYVKVNCGAIPENLLESELFGYEEGAFTGAKRGGKPGYFEMANGGTLFLDEIGELPYDLQAKLLRVVQNRELTRLGGQKVRRVDVRIVAATNRDLYEMVLEKKFREDLYYRLNVVPVNIPPLRERREDITLLAEHFLKYYNETYKMSRRFAPGVISVFEKYDWPGNVRELKNIVERLVVMSVDDVIEKNSLPDRICDCVSCVDEDISLSSLMPLKKAVEEVEKKLIALAYEKCNSTREMGKELGIDASTVVRKAAKYGVYK